MNEPLWTAFAFKGYDPNEMHCTPKFLGEQTISNTQVIRTIINNEIGHLKSTRTRAGFMVDFRGREMFGETKSIPVLLMIDRHADMLADEFGRLRGKLRRFREDDYPAYRPHVTTELHAYSGYIDRYVLMIGKQALAEWEF